MKWIFVTLVNSEFLFKIKLTEKEEEKKNKIRKIIIFSSVTKKIPNHRRSSIFEIKSGYKNSENRDYLFIILQFETADRTYSFRTMGLSAIIKRKLREKGNFPRSENCPGAIIRGYPVKTPSFPCRFNIHW